MAWNHEAGPREMDGGGVVESLPVSRQGKGMASRTNRFINGKFSALVKPKDGFAVSECKDGKARQVLEFLVPILYLEKPTRVTITVGNTIFGALSGERQVYYSLIMRDVVQRVFAGMGRSKVTLLFPYIFQMYHTHEILFPSKKKTY